MKGKWRMEILKQAPIAKAEMLIRKSINEVFEAFIDPVFTTKFWFTKSSGKLEAGKRVQWDWEMYGVSTDIVVKEIEENKRIVIEFGESTVEWVFSAQAACETFVTISNSGFKGDEADIIKRAIASTEGFTIVLCGLKAYLEHDLLLNLVFDKAPYAHVKH